MELTATPSRPALPRRFCRDREDARRQARTSLGLLLAIYALLGLSLAGRAPALILFVLVPPLYVRSALSAHELMHFCRADEVSLLHRLMMLLETPISLGYREHRDIHLRHHRHPATERDPEFFQIRGGHLRAFVHSMVSPEWSLVLYLRERGASRALVAEAAMRGATFVLVAVANPTVFLWYWLTVRLSVGGSAFLFHHALHYRRGQYGTFPLRPSPAIRWVLRVVLGAESVLILLEHPAHHAFQQVKSRHLPEVAPGVPGAAAAVA